MRAIYVFYADVFFVQNFLMDFAALAGANYFLKRRRSWKRILAAAAASSAAGLFVVLWIQNKLLYELVSHFVINTVMVWLCFGWKEKHIFWENWAVIYLAVVLLGGLAQWMREYGLLWDHPFLQILFLFTAGYGILLYVTQKKEFGVHIFPVKIRKGAQCVELLGYRDSGNQLKDPYTGQGISIVSRKAAMQLADLEKQPMRCVPYRSLGETNGLLMVMDVDELCIIEKSREVQIEKAAVGIAEDGLLEDKEYDMILHASFCEIL